LIGLSIVSFAAGKFDDAKNYTESASYKYGVICLLIGQFFHGLQGVTEEYILNFLGQKDIPALYLIGWEGIWGLLLTSLVLTIS